MISHRVLIDIEFTIDEDQFKSAQLADGATGVSDVTDAGVREVVAGRLIQVVWADQGLTPRRSTVSTREQAADGEFFEVVLPAETGVTSG